MMRGTSERRGFALLVVMMIVAFIGLGAAALLDLVNLDIGIAAEHRKALEAQSASVGAVLEAVGDDEFMMRLPPMTDVDLTVPLVRRVGGVYQLDPEGIASQRILTPNNSAHIESLGTDWEAGYEADVRFLRLMRASDSSTDLPIAVYEVTAKATVSGGDATSQARALVYRHVNKDMNTAEQRHAR